MAERQARFEDLVEFPSVFVFRALGAAEDDFAARCIARVEDLLGRKVTSHELRPSARGRWLSVRIAVTVISAEEIRSVYTALHEVDGIRMVL